MITTDVKMTWQCSVVMWVFRAPAAVSGQPWPTCAAVMLMTLERFDGTMLAGRSTRAELLMVVTPAGTRLMATPPADMFDCDTLTGMIPGCPTAPSVVAACSSVCVVVVGGAEAKLGAADGATLVVTGLGHLSSVRSSVGRQIDKMYASESAVGSFFLIASAMDVCR